MLCDELPNHRDEVAGDLHQSLCRVLGRRFILGHRFSLGLLLVVRQDALNTRLVPPRWGLALPHRFPFLRRRLRYAISGWPFRSYAVMTNTLSGSGSGT